MSDRDWRDPEGPEAAKKDFDAAVNVLLLGVPGLIKAVKKAVSPTSPRP